MPKYSPQLAAQFLELVARGRSVTAACHAVSITDSAVQQWRRAHPAFRAAYAIAQHEAKTPALPAGECLARWEKIILESEAPHLPAANVC